DRDGTDAEVGGGARDANRDLAAVGDKQAGWGHRAINIAGFAANSKPCPPAKVNASVSTTSVTAKRRERAYGRPRPTLGRSNLNDHWDLANEPGRLVEQPAVRGISGHARRAA